MGFYLSPLHPRLVYLPLLLISPVQYAVTQQGSLLRPRDVEGLAAFCRSGGKPVPFLRGSLRATIGCGGASPPPVFLRLLGSSSPPSRPLFTSRPASRPRFLLPDLQPMPPPPPLVLGPPPPLVLVPSPPPVPPAPLLPVVNEESCEGFRLQASYVVYLRRSHLRRQWVFFLAALVPSASSGPSRLSSEVSSSPVDFRHGNLLPMLFLEIGNKFPVS